MNKRLIIIGVLSLAVLAAVGLYLLFQKPATTPRPTPTPTPAVQEKDRALLGQLSGELAAKFQTYSKPAATEYFESIKPYLTESFYQQVVLDNKRAAEKIHEITPVQSAASKVKSVQANKDSATVVVTINSTEGTLRYDQEVEVHWVKAGDRWSADSLLVNNSTRPQE